MSLVVMGLSHRTSSIQARERAAILEENVPEVLHQIAGTEGIKGAAIVSTCNRVEILVDAKTDRIGSDVLADFFQARTGDTYREEDYYLHRGMDAVRHVLRVVCSLDSQVLGEAQILGQMKHAFDVSTQQNACNEVMAKLFKVAISLGKRVRTETAIGGDSVSLSTTAMKVARDTVDDLTEATVLVIGAGEMAHLTATYLVEAGVKNLVVTSRTYEHAYEFAQEFGAHAVPFAQRYKQIAHSDVVFTMTGAADPIVAQLPLERARKAADAEKRPLLMIDEAVPRDVDPGCSELPEVTVYNIEALSSVIDEGLATRMSAVAEVERMVEEAQDEFFTWLQERLVVPTIKEIYRKGSITVDDELARAKKELAKLHDGELTAEEEAVLSAYGNAIMKKLLHGPTVRLRKEATTADSYYYTGSARYLFGLETFPPGTHRCHKECEKGEECPVRVPHDQTENCASRRRVS